MSRAPPKMTTMTQRRGADLQATHAKSRCPFAIFDLPTRNLKECRLSPTLSSASLGFQCGRELNMVFRGYYFER